MAQLMLLVAVGILAWWGYKKFLAEAKRVSASVRRAEKEAKTGAQGTLVKDPETGEYRLEKKSDDM